MSFSVLRVTKSRQKVARALKAMHKERHNFFQRSCIPKDIKTTSLKSHYENVHSEQDYMKMSSIYQQTMKSTKPSKPIPPALDLRILQEFAFIATGPQSPLVQYGAGTEAESPVDIRDIDYNIPSVESDASATTPTLPTTTAYRHATPPPTAWSCFMDGTRIQLEGEEKWSYAEELGNDDIPNICDPSDGLRVTGCERIVHVVERMEDTVHEFLVSFFSTSANLPSLRAEVPGNHPFFVKTKGWCAMQPARALEDYRMVCQQLSRGDVCLPSSHPTVMKANRMPTRPSTNMFDFTDLDSRDAALTLSSMAKDRQEHKTRKSKLDREVQSRPSSPTDKQLNKRPMNAFMLFAKQYRVKITKAHPGKDNRAISVILGDKWKSMKQDERNQYVTQAKQLAEEHKKHNPDCWKRKRTTSQTGRAKVLKRL